MKKFNFGQTMQILANVGVLAGIGFLAFELRQNTTATRLIAVDNFLSSAGDLSEFIAGTEGFAEIIVKAQHGEPLSDTDALRLDVFSIHVLRTYQNVHFQYLSGVLDEEIWQSYESNLLRTLSNDRPLREYWRANKFRLTPAFNALVAGLIQEIDDE